MIEPGTGGADVGAPGSGLWLETLQRIATRAAHEVKNSLNGVAVNLEVVRVRASRAADAESIARFASTASAQLELLIRQIDALLGVVRRPAREADVAAVARQLHLLLERTGPEGSVLRLDAPDGLAAPTAADPAVVRLLLGRLLLGLAEGGGNAELALRVHQDGGVEASARAEPPVALDAECRDIAAAAGVAVLAAGNGTLTLTFPAASAAETL